MCALIRHRKEISMIKGSLLFIGGMFAGVMGVYAAKKGWYSTSFAYMAAKSKQLEAAVRQA
jgi:hypothetical membrane protein